MTLTLKSFLGVFILSFFSSLSSAQIISTIAGNGTNSSCGDGGLATSACVQATDVAFDASGNMYIAGGLSVRKVTPAGVISTFAGGTAGTSGDNGPATSAQFVAARGIAVDATGNVFVCDGNRVRKINTSGIITTVVGSTTAGYGGDNGAATSATLNAPADVAFDAVGNMLIADKNNHRIRRVNTSGIITTFIGTGSGMYSGESYAPNVSLNSPNGVVADAAGNVYIADDANNRIRKYSFTTGFVNTIMNNMGTGGLSGDGGLAINAHCNNPKGVAVDGAGNVYFTANNMVRVIRPTGKVYAFAGYGGANFSGDGGLAVGALMNGAVGMAFNSSNEMFIGDLNNYRVRKVSACSAVPAAPASLTGDVIVCPGSYYTYTVPLGNDIVYYEWTLPQFWNGGSNGPSMTTMAYETNGTVTVKAVNMCGSSTALTLNVSNAIPANQITPLGPQLARCTDELGQGSTQLSLVVPPNCSVQWYNMFGPMWGQTGPTLNVTATGNYSALITHNTLGCSTFTGNRLVEDLYPQIYGSSFTICEGDTAHIEYVYPIINAPLTYQWKVGGVNIPGATAPSYNATQAGDYTVFVSAPNCSVLSNGIEIGITDTTNFTITPSGPLTICPGGSVQFVVNTSTFPSIEWFKDGNIMGYNNYTATTPGNYTVLFTEGGCTATAAYTVAADTPQAIVTAGGATEVCVGNSVQLQANTGTGFGYQWQKNGVNIPGATSATYAALSSGNYSAIVDEGSCTDTSTFITVTVDTPQAIITAGGPTTLCEGESVLLEANTGLGFTYQWMLNGNYLGGSVTSSYTADEPGVFSVIVDEGLCSDTADLIVTVNPLPTPTITQSGNDLSVPSGFVTYQWYLNGNAISGATSETYTATQDGDYYVVVSDGCEGQSNTVNLFLSIGDMNAGGSSIVIRPNPFSDFAVLTFDNTQRLAHSFKLYNVQGQLVQDLRNITTGELKIERGILSAGVYYFQLHNDKGVAGKGKLIIQ